MATSDLRRLAPEDHPSVAAMWHRAWHDAHAALCPDHILRHRTPESFVRRLPGYAADAWVATDDEGPVVFAALDGTEVDQLFLAERARGRGLGTRTMDRLEDMMRDRGLAVAELDCMVGNERARRFYLSRGYVELATADRPVWMPDGSAAVFPIHRLAKRLDR